MSARFTDTHWYRAEGLEAKFQADPSDRLRARAFHCRSLGHEAGRASSGEDTTMRFPITSGLNQTGIARPEATRKKASWLFSNYRWGMVLESARIGLEILET